MKYFSFRYPSKFQELIRPIKTGPFIKFQQLTFTKKKKLLKKQENQLILQKELNQVEKSEENIEYTQIKKIYDDLINWTKEYNSQFGKIELSFINKDNRYISASENLKVGDIIMKIPKELILAPKYLRKDLYNSIQTKLKKNKVQAIYLYLNTYITSGLNKPDEFFKKYFQIFPEKFDNFPYFYDQKEIKLLQGSFFYQEMKKCKQDELEDYTNLKKNFPTEFKNCTFENFLKVSCLVNSRLFQVEEKFNQKIKSLMMVPVCDLFNHSFDRNANWYMNTDETFEVVAVEKIDKGSEITIYYGDDSNQELLLYYGFTIPNNKFGKITLKCMNYMSKDVKNLIQSNYTLLKNFYEIELDFKGRIMNHFKDFRELFYFLDHNEINRYSMENIFSRENELEVVKFLLNLLNQIKDSYDENDDRNKLKSKEIQSDNEKNILNAIQSEIQILEKNIKVLKIIQSTLLRKNQTNNFKDNNDDNILADYLSKIKKII